MSVIQNSTITVRNTLKDKILTRKISIIALGIIIGLLSCEQKQTHDPTIIGYIQDSLFHPFVQLQNNEYVKYDYTQSIAGKTLNPTFGTYSRTINILSDFEYEDLYSDDTARVGYIDTLINNRSAYYMLSNKGTSLQMGYDIEIIHDFYRFFSTDKWGKHFIDAEWIDQPIDSIEFKSDLRIAGVTDIDEDGSHEIWLSYLLMWGEIGHAVYEETEQPGTWKSVANHCMNCD